MATRNGSSRVDELLLRAGCDKESKDNDEATPLHYAASNGWVEVVKVLLAAGLRDGNQVARPQTAGIGCRERANLRRNCDVVNPSLAA